MSTLTQDESGAFTGNGPSASDLIGSSGGSAPVASPSPYDKANLALMYILQKGQAAGSTAPLYAQQDQMQNQALNLSNPFSQGNPLAPGYAALGYNAPAAEANEQAAFQPGLTAITSQIQAQNDASAKFNANVNSAENIVQNQKNIVSPGQSIVDNNGNVLYQGHSYTPTANPATGQIDGFDAATGTWLSDAKMQENSTTTPPAAGSNVVVGGVDLSGASTGSQPYAKDPNYSTEVNGIYQALSKGMPVANAPALDTYIGGHAKSSPVTGSMIMNAATTYGIDPTLLTSVLAQESDFGTTGAGADTNNPGNVGNTDGGATMTYKSVQAGVNAAAAELAKRMPGNPNAGKPSGSLNGATANNTLSSVTDPVGGKYSVSAAPKVQQITPALQSYVFAGPLGVAYMDSTRVPAEFQTIAAAQAAKAGIPYLDATAVGNLQKIGQVYDALNNVQQVVSTQLKPGFLGGLKDIGKAALHAASFGNIDPNLSAFNTLRQTAIGTIQALNGGVGSGLRLNVGEIEGALSSLPSDTDTSTNANVKLQKVITKLNAAMAADFPYVQGSQPGAAGASGGATSGVTSSGLSYTVTP